MIYAIIFCKCVSILEAKKWTFVIEKNNSMSKDKGSKNKKKAPSNNGKVKQMSTYKSENEKSIRDKSTGLDIQTTKLIKKWVTSFELRSTQKHRFIYANTREEAILSIDCLLNLNKQRTE